MQHLQKAPSEERVTPAIREKYGEAGKDNPGPGLDLHSSSPKHWNEPLRSNETLSVVSLTSPLSCFLVTVTKKLQQ